MSGNPLVLEVPDLVIDRGAETLRLRQWQRTDALSLVAAWSDSAVQDGSTPPDDRSLAAAEQWIAGVDERRRRGVALDLAIDLDGAVVGEVGLSGFDSTRRAALVGWWVHEAHRGNGIASAAVAAVREWALGAGGLRALMAEVGVGNVASKRVAEAAGFAEIEDSRNPQERARGAGPRVWYVAISTVK